MVVSSDISCTSSQESLNQAPPLPPDYISALSCAPASPTAYTPPTSTPTRSQSDYTVDRTTYPPLPEKTKAANQLSCPPALASDNNKDIIRNKHKRQQLLSPGEPSAEDRRTLTPDNVDQLTLSPNSTDNEEAVYGNLDAATPSGDNKSGQKLELNSKTVF